MDLDTFLTCIYVCLPLIFAVICLVISFNFLKYARSMEDLPTSKIRSAAQGYVELKGNARSLLKEPILGKLTLKPCVWYYYTVRELRTIQNGSQNSTSWQILEQGMPNDPFIINDDTGECIILPKGAEIKSSNTIAWRGHSRTPKPPPTSFLIWLLWTSWGKYLYSEYRIELDATIFASGQFVTVKQTDLRVQNNTTLQTYFNEKNITSANLLIKEGLEKNENFIVSAVPSTRIIRQQKLKALMFFIGFIFFMSISVNSTYPVVKKMLKTNNNHAQPISLR